MFFERFLTAHLLNVESDALITSDSLGNYVYNNYNLNTIYHLINFVYYVSKLCQEICLGYLINSQGC